MQMPKFDLADFTHYQWSKCKAELTLRPSYSSLSWNQFDRNHDLIPSDFNN